MTARRLGRREPSGLRDLQRVGIPIHVCPCAGDQSRSLEEVGTQFY